MGGSLSTQKDSSGNTIIPKITSQDIAYKSDIPTYTSFDEQFGKKYAQKTDIPTYTSIDEQFGKKYAQKTDIPTAASFQTVFDTKYAPFNSYNDLQTDYNTYKTTNTNNLNSLQTSFNDLKSTTNNNFNNLFSLINGQSASALAPPSTLIVYNPKSKYNTPLETNFASSYNKSLNISFSGTIGTLMGMFSVMISNRWVAFKIIDTTEYPSYSSYFNTISGDNSYTTTSGISTSKYDDPRYGDVSTADGFDVIKTIGALKSYGLSGNSINIGSYKDEINSTSTAVDPSFRLKAGHTFIFVVVSNQPGTTVDTNTPTAKNVYVNSVPI